MSHIRRRGIDEGCINNLGCNRPLRNERRAGYNFLICNDRGFIGETRILDCRYITNRRNRGICGC